MITMTREEIEDYLEELVKMGHARVVGLTESGKKQYAMTEEGLFAGEPNVEYALLVKVKERRVIMAVKHPTDTLAESEEAALNIFLCGPCGPAAGSEGENAVEIWGFVLPFDQRDIDFNEYTLEGYDPDQTEFACRGAGLWRDWEDMFEKGRRKREIRAATGARGEDLPRPVPQAQVGGAHHPPCKPGAARVAARNRRYRGAP